MTQLFISLNYCRTDINQEYANHDITFVHWSSKLFSYLPVHIEQTTRRYTKACMTNIQNCADNLETLQHLYKPYTILDSAEVAL